MKICVTGAAGMLGSDICIELSRLGHTVVALSRQDLDVRDPNLASEVIGAHNPQVVVHAAAITDLVKCEESPDDSFNTNFKGTINVVRAAERVGAKLIYISSCGVFDGKKSAPYTEQDEPRPQTEYHKSKFEGEQQVLTASNKFLVLRTGWLFGGQLGHKRNFVSARARQLAEGQRLIGVTNRFGSPTYTADFAVKAEEMIRKDCSGLYHVANQGFVSGFEYVSAISEALGFSNSVDRAETDQLVHGLKSPPCEAIVSARLAEEGIGILRPWKEALLAYIEKSGLRNHAFSDCQ